MNTRGWPPPAASAYLFQRFGGVRLVGLPPDMGMQPGAVWLGPQSTVA